MDTEQITYLMNDPGTPELVKEVPVPHLTENDPNFSVVGYEGGGFPLGSTQAQAANVFYNIFSTVRMVNRFNTESPLKTWATQSILRVIPRAGKKLNASYNRRNLSFYYITNYYGQDIYTADSADIVCHELGHAVLDSYRPDLWNIASLEIWAFHEAFGDMLSMLSVMQHDEVIEYVLKQTDGDLKKQNIVACVAEQLGKVMRGHHNGLRTATNKFNYIAPETLPRQGKEHELLSEPHNFSRILSGAIYDVFVMMYEQFLESKSPSEAFQTARDILAGYILKAIRFTPNTPKMFEGFCRTLLWVDFSLPERPFHDRMWDIFAARNLLSETILAAQSEVTPPITLLFAPQTIKLSNYVVSSQSGDNPLYDLDLEIHGGLDDAIPAASDLVDYLYKSELVGEDHPFEISDGKLVRSHFDCCGAGPTKYQPEYYRPYKPQNNTGCCGTNVPKNTVTVPKTIKRGCGIRYIVPR